MNVPGTTPPNQPRARSGASTHGGSKEEEVTSCDLYMDIQAIAPEYEMTLITIRDRFEVQTKWMLPAGPLAGGDIEILQLLHVRFSQQTTKRN